MEKLASSMDEQILEILFSKDIEKIENQSTKPKTFYRVFCKTYINSGTLTRVPYHFISILVYNSSESYEERNERLLANLDYIKNSAESLNLEHVEKFNKKVMDHYLLVKEQKKHLDENIHIINGEIEKFKDDISKAKEKVDAIKTENQAVNQEMKDTKDKLYSEFVAILGIFSALMFGLFGGFEGLAASITTLATGFDIGKTIMVSSAIFLAITAFVYALIQWVGKIIRKPLNSCGCVILNDCTHSFYERNKSFILIVLIQLIVFLIGFLTLLSRITGITIYLRMFNRGLVLFWVVLSVTLALTAFVIRLIYIKNNKSI